MRTLNMLREERAKKVADMRGPTDDAQSALLPAQIQIDQGNLVDN